MGIKKGASKMAKPAKVNAYYFVAAFATKTEKWWVLSDGEVAIVVKPENVFEVDQEKHLFSLMYQRDTTTHTFRVKDTEMIVMTDYGITLYKKKDATDDSNKNNDAKI